jgi:predicted nucleic acid-binding protein
MRGAAFLDNNLLVHAALRPDARSDRACALLAEGGVVSVQVLNEFANVARRKLRRPWPEVRRALADIRALCPPPLPITLAAHEAALGIAGRLGCSIYDSLVVASALEANCATLFSEDMRDGQVIEGKLTIRDPFKP